MLSVFQRGMRLGKESLYGKEDTETKSTSRLLYFNITNNLASKGSFYQSSTPLFRLTFIPRFHCEGRIVCTLFGLLFWDILFADVPGAFETKYQSAPLDIASDCFYYAREGLIKERLAEIKQGKARQISEKVDNKHRPKGTLCVGVRWDLFTRQDLLEIVDVSRPVHISDSSAHHMCLSVWEVHPCQLSVAFSVRIIRDEGEFRT